MPHAIKGPNLSEMHYQEIGQTVKPELKDLKVQQITAGGPEQFVNTLDTMTAHYDPADPTFSPHMFYHRPAGTTGASDTVIPFEQMRFLSAAVRRDFGRSLARRGRLAEAQQQFLTSARSNLSLLQAKDSGGAELVKNIPGGDQDRDTVHEFVGDTLREAARTTYAATKDVNQSVNVLPEALRNADEIKDPDSRISDIIETNNLWMVMAFDHKAYQVAADDMKKSTEKSKKDISDQRPPLPANGKANTSKIKMLSNHSAALAMTGKKKDLEDAVTTIKDVIDEDASRRVEDRSATALLNSAIINAAGHHDGMTSAAGGSLQAEARRNLTAARTVISARVAAGSMDTATEARLNQLRTEITTFTGNAATVIAPSTDLVNAEVTAGTVKKQAPKKRGPKSQAHSQAEKVATEVLRHAGTWAAMGSDQETLRSAVTDYMVATLDPDVHKDSRKAYLASAGKSLADLRAKGVTNQEVYNWSAMIAMEAGDMVHAREHMSEAQRLAGGLNPSVASMKNVNFYAARAMLRHHEGKKDQATQIVDHLRTGTNSAGLPIRYRVMMLDAQLKDAQGRRTEATDTVMEMMKSAMADENAGVPIARESPAQRTMHRFAEKTLVKRADAIAKDSGKSAAKDIYWRVYNESLGRENRIQRSVDETDSSRTSDDEKARARQRITDHRHVVTQLSAIVDSEKDHYTKHQLERAQKDLQITEKKPRTQRKSKELRTEIETLRVRKDTYNAAVNEKDHERAGSRLADAADSMVDPTILNTITGGTRDASISETMVALMRTQMAGHTEEDPRAHMILYQYADRTIEFLESKKGERSIPPVSRLNIKDDVRDALDFISAHNPEKDDYRIGYGKTLKELRAKTH
ncbi:hypothetical protein ACFLRF_04940 [Candidatus Altiarchaeota archaeon]